ELGAEDAMVFVAESYEACVPTREPQREKPATRPVRPSQVARTRERTPRRVLVLGWNQKVPALLRELARSHLSGGTHEVDVLSVQPIAERESDKDGRTQGMVRVRHLEGDYTVPGVLAALEPW